MEKPMRKTIRLQGYDYNGPGCYFITICTDKKRKLLCEIVGTGLLDGPRIQLTEYGVAAEKQLQVMSDFYEDIKLEKYVIMPNHIHMLIQIIGSDQKTGDLSVVSGASGRSVPSVANSKVSRFVGTFKRFCNRAYGHNIWQYRSHDHVIRGEKDYLKIWEYIESNPARWTEDCFYVE